MGSHEWKSKEKKEGKGRGLVKLWLTLLFSLFFVLTANAEDINLNLTYGYQNTAKAGRFLPLRIDMENTMPETFTGYVHVYMAESAKQICEYQYQALVEGNSESSLMVNLSLSTGVNQLLVTAEGRDGRVYGSKRIGLDVSSSDAELVIGILSEESETLSYFNGIGLNNGLVRTKTVSLNPEKLPQDETELDQLDMILISNYELSNMKRNENAALNRWVENGGILLIGTGMRGETALTPYYKELLRGNLNPQEMTVDMDVDRTEPEKLIASPVYLFGGRELQLSDGLPLLSIVSRGAGILAVSGYDFCELQRFGTEHSDYVDQLLTEILGEQRLEKLSISATEKSLERYWDMEAMMNQSDISKLPKTALYLIVLFFYVLMIGPGLRLFLSRHEAPRMYRPTLLLLSCLFAVLIFIMGMDTRFSGPFLTYGKWKDYTEQSVDETAYLNLRSPYRDEYGMSIKTEYSIYPFLKGSDYKGDISDLRAEEGIAHTSIEYLRDHSEIRVRNEQPFTAKYFELHNKMPNTGGSFEGQINYFNGELSGVITNGTDYTLYDGAILLYGRLIRIGKLEAGESRDLSGLTVETVPIRNGEWTASRIANGNSREFLKYYLNTQLDGYFSQAKLLGFFHEDPLGFSETGKMESYGVSMGVASIPLNNVRDGEVEFPALRTDPELLSGDYENNSISTLVPTILSYPLGEEEIKSLRFESLSMPSSITEEQFRLLPFQGNVSFYNYQSGGYDSVDYRNQEFSAEALRPYLNKEHVLRVRYTPKDEGLGAFTRLYLPMPLVTAEEMVIKENSSVPVVQVDAGAETAQTETDTETEEEG